MFDSLQPHGLQPTRLLYPWNSPGKNTGEACHVLLQGMFLTLGFNPCLWVHNHYHQLGSSYIYMWVRESQSVMSDYLRPYGLYSSMEFTRLTLEWVAVPFSRGFPNLGIEPRSPALQADYLPAEPAISLHIGLQIPKVLINASEASVVCQSPVHFSWTPASNFQCHQDLESKLGNGNRSPSL